MTTCKPGTAGPYTCLCLVLPCTEGPYTCRAIHSLVLKAHTHAYAHECTDQDRCRHRKHMRKYKDIRQHVHARSHTCVYIYIYIYIYIYTCIYIYRAKVGTGNLGISVCAKRFRQQQRVSRKSKNCHTCMHVCTRACEYVHTLNERRTSKRTTQA